MSDDLTVVFVCRPCEVIVDSPGACPRCQRETQPQRVRLVTQSTTASGIEEAPGSCACEKCVHCCWTMPGWFGSGEEVIGAAAILGLDVGEFARQYLIRDRWAPVSGAVIPAPRRDFSRWGEGADLYGDRWTIEESGPGFLRTGWGYPLLRGYACIFLDESSRCRIEESKPEECRVIYGCRPTPIVRPRIAGYWAQHQGFVQSLVAP